MPSLRNAAVHILVLGCASFAVVSPARGQNWIGNALAPDWSNANNWDAKLVSAANTQLTFGTSKWTPTTQNAVNPFQLNLLTFTPDALGYEINPATPTPFPLQFSARAVNMQPQIINNSPTVEMVNVPVQIDNNATLTLGGTGASPAQLQLNGVVSGGGSISINGTGSFLLGGPSVANTYTGNTTLTTGELVIDNGQALGPKGALSIAGGTIRAGKDAAQTIGNAVTLDGNATFGNSFSSQSLTFTSPATLTGSRAFVVNSALVNFAAGITDGGKNFGVTISGDAAYSPKTKTLTGGRMKLGNGNIGGPVLINKGGAVTLTVASANIIPAGVTVAAKAFFGGNGNVKAGTGAKLTGMVKFQGQGYFKCPNDGSLGVTGLDPSTAAVEFQSGSVYAEDIEGLDPGDGYTTMSVATGYGDIDPGAMLDVNPTIPLAIDDTFEIMTRDETPLPDDNEFSDVNGIPIPEGTDFTEDGYTFQINYGATDDGLPTGGNDVLLTVVGVPEPASCGLLGLTSLAFLRRVRRTAR